MSGRPQSDDAIIATVDEREACAVLADEYAKRAWAAKPPAQEAAVAAEHIAQAIRARK